MFDLAKHLSRCATVCGLAVSTVFAEEMTFVYDDLNQLVNVGYSTGVSIQYDYDPAGNRVAFVATNMLSARPAVTTDRATLLLNNSATLKGCVNSAGKPTTAWFEWGTSPALGNRTPAQNVGTGTLTVAYSASIVGLMDGLSYYFRAVAENAAGTAYGETRLLNSTPPTASNLNQSIPGFVGQTLIPLKDIVVSDPDPGAQITAKLWLLDTSAGRLSVAGGGAYDSLTGIWSVTGTLPFVNAALAQVAFLPAIAFNGTVPILVHVQDASSREPLDGAITITISTTIPDWPNLRPFQRSGWTDKIVVHRTMGASTNGSDLTTSDSLYVDCCVVNDGTATSPAFLMSIYVDGVLKNTWNSGGSLAPGNLCYAMDYPIGTLSAGTHTIKMVIDVAETMYELDEADNEYTKTFTVYADPCIKYQPASQTTLLGGMANFQVTAFGTQPYGYQWRRNGVVLASATTSLLTVTNVQPSDAGDYSVVVSNPRGNVTSQTAVLAIGTNNVVDAFAPDVNGLVSTLAVQPDGKILLGGSFTTVAGQTRNGIARLNVDGTLDNSFNANANGAVSVLALQSDLKVVIIGSFTKSTGQIYTRIARLNTDGTPDVTFTPNDADIWVSTLAVQPDGKILVGGYFTTIAGQTRNSIARLNTDGTLDATFNPGVSSYSMIYCFAQQADGKILVGGQFTTLAGQSRNNIGRLNADGSLDANFNPNVPFGSSVYTTTIQPSGKILVGGSFTTVAGLTRNRIARLNIDGTIDSAFDPNVSSSVVYGLALQADGKILAGGGFTNVAGQARNRIARFNADGTLDATFNPGADGPVRSIVALVDGRVLAVGEFTSVAGQTRNGIARFEGLGAVTENLSYADSTVTWLRGGTTPEVWRTTFEHTTNGISWAFLGAGCRIAGGWALSGVSVSGGTIRARGYAAGGYANAAGGIVESVLGPWNRTNNAGTTAIFTLLAGGSTPTECQWRKNGSNLVEGGNLSGVTMATLNVSSLSKGDEGGYDVVYRSASGVMTSAVATLMVVDPYISSPPWSQVGQMGGCATFSVTASGTGMSYQWRMDGVVLPGETSSSLVLTNLQCSAAGSYDVTVSGTYGCATSATATLSVNAATLDRTFAPSESSAAGDSVYTVAIQPDSKIVVGGYFASMAGQARNSIARFKADGTSDLDYNPNPIRSGSASVYCIAHLADGKTLVGGLFTSLGGQSCNNIGRLNADGTLDTTFSPGANSLVFSLTVQPDKKILACGLFTTMGGQTRNRLARLNVDGSLDTGFTADANAAVRVLAMQADGEILVVGDFTTLAGQTRNYIARLNADGTPDANFNPSANGVIYSLAVQRDGKILVGGSFTVISGQPRKYLARLDADGSLDATFDPKVEGGVIALALQVDGKILLSGAFASIAGQTRRGIARLSEDGTLDAIFNPGTAGNSQTLAVQADGKILVGGSFTILGGQTRSCITRLNNTGAATEHLSYDGARLVWLRGGTGPEVWRTTFEHTTNGVAWTLLGAGTRTNGGWMLSGVLVTGGALRARGWAAGGYVNGSGSVVESTIGTPVISTQPQSRTNNAGTTATFAVGVAGSGTFAYQWRKDGINLTDGGNLFGTTGTTLNVGGVLRSDEGGYDVICSNMFGVVTSTVARLTVVDPAISVSPVNQAGVLGGSAVLRITAGATDVRYQWRRNGVVLTGATNTALALSSLQASDAGNYDVTVSGAFGSVTSAVAMLSINCALLDANFNPSANMGVYALAVQPDGKILLGGQFTSLAGLVHNRIGRLNTDGSLDLNFNPNANDIVTALAVQPDGKILVGGVFTSLGGQTRTCLGRLNADGTLDAAFNPWVGGTAYKNVNALAVQNDGKILVGGYFTSLGGQTRNNIARLNTDGTLDASFNPGANDIVYAIVLQPDGKILVGGYFTSLAGQTRSHMARLNADGMLDASFNPGADNDVLSFTVQTDGKILVGGRFITLGDQPRSYIGRLNVDGTLDSTFNPGANGQVHSLVLQTDGRILVGGYFATIAGQTRNNIARLNADGTLDPALNPNASYSAGGLAVQADGRILVAGDFTSLDGQGRNRVARLDNTGAATESLSYAGSTVTWLRGGSSPEVWRTTFEHTTDGVSWAFLGAGSRVSGGWELSGVSVSGGTIRARGFTVGGNDNASGGIMESTVGTPVIAGQPSSRTNNAGTTATFAVGVAGSGTFAYQWRKDGINLTDGGKLSGTTGATLNVSGVLRSDEGGYDVICSNIFGVVTSAVARLTVVDPAITVSPSSYAGELGGSVGFIVTVAGTGALTYQWRKDGLVLQGKTNTSLALTGLQASDAGNYDVTVSGAFGSVTSAVAMLSINLASLDAGFDPGANGGVNALAVQPDGKILVGGGFTSIAGQTRHGIAQINADGTLDPAFNPNANDIVTSLAVQPDGKILVGGQFTSLSGQTRTCLGRLNTDGTLDGAFNQWAGGTAYNVCALAVQNDGKILVGGYFTSLGGQTRNNIARLNADGTLDASFNPGSNDAVYVIAQQLDGKILVGGYFTSLGGQTRSHIARLNADGTLDVSFNPGANDAVSVIAPQPDGKILVGGWFTMIGGQARNYIARLNTDGTLDTTFNPIADSAIVSIVLQTDGRILMGGYFGTLAGQTRNYVARLNADGTLDATFNPNPNNSVDSLAVQADGRILLGGGFTSLGGQTRERIARLHNTSAATESLTCDNSTVTWLRGGTAPECWRTTFETSVDGSVWTSFGVGTRIAGGWELGGVSLPPGAMIRARGFVAGGDFNSSGWFVETLGRPPEIAVQPASRTNAVDTTAQFAVSVSAPGPLSYQWRKDGVNLTDGWNVSGAFSTNLILRNVNTGDAGAYSVVVSNSFGSVTSQVATLIVLLPPVPLFTAGPATRGLAPLTVYFTNQSANATTFLWDFGDGKNSAVFSPTNTYTNAGQYTVILEANGPGGTASVTNINYIVATNAPLQFGVSGLNGVSLNNGLVQFELSGGEHTLAVVLEASTDMLNWQPILTNSAGMPLHFVVPVGTYSHRFYRARQ